MFKHPPQQPFPPWPQFAPDEIAAVSAVLRSGKVNQWTGEEVFAFEREYARHLQRDYAVALANGSVALDIALRVLGVGAGDEVIVPSRSFVASAACVVLAGAKPVFSDVEPDSQTISARTIASLITSRTKAVICVHLAGWPCEMDELAALCRRRGVWLIEDCAQAHGARYRGRPAGAFGDIACFSFCQDKIISTGGEGGLLATSDRSLWKKAWSYKDHGRGIEMIKRKNGQTRFVWSVRSFGTNLRMTEVQACLGRLMLKKLPGWVKRRRELAHRLAHGFSSVSGLRLSAPPAHMFHSYYKYYASVEPDALRPGWSRDRIIDELHRGGIPCGVGVCPEIYREQAFREYARRQGLPAFRRLPVSRRLGERCLMFLVHPTLTFNHQDRVVSAVRQLMQRAIR